MFLRRSSLVALCVSFALLCGCRAHTSGFTEFNLTHEVSPQPPRVGPTTITFNLTDTAGKPITGARIALEANMSHAGMAPMSTEAIEVAPGHYRAILALTMAGDWIVTAHVFRANHPNADYQFEINGVASP